MSTTVTHTDYEGTRPWISITETRDANGVLESQVVYNDDGTIVTSSYRYGEIYRKVVEDGAGDFGWHTLTYGYTQGGVGHENVLYDNGQGRSMAYFTSGQLAYTTFQDGTGVQSAYEWSTMAHYYDNDGDIREVNVWTDDRRFIRTNYEDGIKSSQFIVDIDGQFGWSRLDYTFDENGVLATETATLRNGSTRTATFEDGRRVEETLVDQDGDLPFEFIRKEYDEDGNVATITEVLDDGRTVESQYQDGERISQLIRDSADDFAWATISITYDDEGDVASKDVIYDIEIEEMLGEGGNGEGLIPIDAV